MASLDAFTDNDYPLQTLPLAHLLKLLASKARDELRGLTIADSIVPSEYARARDLGRIVHVLHSYLRYLQASEPLRTPPGVQHAMHLLIATHAKTALDCGAEDIDVLVRPQWTYNLKYIDIIHQFEFDAECIVTYALDPTGVLGASDVRSLVEKLWELDQPGNGIRLPSSAPKHVAVLSFAGLDRDDVLNYPLLAHELGHFFDFALEDLGRPSTDSTAFSFLPTTKETLAAGLKPNEHNSFVELIRVCLREITADLLAARMAGLGYFFAFAEFFKTLTPWPGQMVSLESGYPGFARRLSLIWEELDSAGGGIESIASLERLLRRWRGDGKETLAAYLTASRGRFASIKYPKPASRVAELAEAIVEKAIPAIQALVRNIIPNAEAAKLASDVEDMVELLDDRIPPYQPSTRAKRRRREYRSWCFHEIMTAGWLYQIGIGEKRERRLPVDKRLREYANTCLLLSKALELEGSYGAIQSIAKTNNQTDAAAKPVSRNARLGRGVISGPSLRTALDRRSRSARLVLCPDYGDGAIESASRDLHLGHWFRISKRTALERIDIAYTRDRTAARRLGQSECFVPADGKFVLQPGDFSLAVSMEYIYLPPGMMAFVEGKSSLGRAGLLVATATQVAPGFKGSIVLELFNAGTVPVVLRPAMRVAQLVLVSTDANVPPAWLYAGSFQVQIKP